MIGTFTVMPSETGSVAAFVFGKRLAECVEGFEVQR